MVCHQAIAVQLGLRLAHLVVSDLLIYPFSFKELTHT